MTEYYLAQLNVARMKGETIDDAIMKDFKDGLDKINELAESSPGFVWRLKDEESNSATSIQAYEDPRILVNLSIWEGLEPLKEFVYKSMHKDYVKRRQEWMEPFGKRYLVLWWVPKDHRPTPQEAVAKLQHLQDHGPTAEAFTFQKHFPPPCST